MNHSIEDLTSEYLAYIENAKTDASHIDWGQVHDWLCFEGDWTSQGAEHLIAIARNYGSFFLKNAYALAIAANIEDGQLGL